ncbi:hypothetical protein MKW98_008937 [Papaver atlanticum]|uniref:Uncharacterized protein n=1 Tax=Papaver atlanticum TaxID=357466 RepID=A0AAD4SJQ8_9MAGN|nr:hypothetical protein MKW98_008937 [Papaver atlanticum]
MEDRRRSFFSSSSVLPWNVFFFWLSNSDRSTAGAKAREAVAFNHCGCSKSHVVHRAEKRKVGFEEGDIQTFYDTHTSTNKETGEVVWISDEARIKWDTMNELMQQGIEAGATPPTEAEVCAQVLKKKQRRRRSAITVSNSEGIHEMLQAQADRIQAQDEQICAQNEVIRMLKEDSEKVIRNMHDMMIRSLGINNITTNGIES